jgi:hypothetical protein
MNLLIKETSEELLSNCINKAIFCPRCNDVNHISAEVCNSLDTRVKTYPSVNFVLCEDEERHLQVEFEIVPNIFLFISLYW